MTSSTRTLPRPIARPTRTWVRRAATDLVPPTVLPFAHAASTNRTHSRSARAAYFSDILVGAICSRVEPEGSGFKVYIMTIGVLAPYRHLGIGGLLLQQVLEACAREPDCHEIYLHVHVKSDDAMDFYRRFGFTVGDVVHDYYTKLDPNDAYIVYKSPPFTSPAEGGKAS